VGPRAGLDGRKISAPPGVDPDWATHPTHTHTHTHTHIYIYIYTMYNDPKMILALSVSTEDCCDKDTISAFVYLCHTYEVRYCNLSVRRNKVFPPVLCRCSHWLRPTNMTVSRTFLVSVLKNFFLKTVIFHNPTAIISLHSFVLNPVPTILLLFIVA